VKPDKICGLGEALHHWLSFQILCGREALLSESYLNQPTGEYLLKAAGKSHLKTEHSHPVLNKLGKKGRPRQIDFCLLSEVKKHLTTAIELKWITQSPLNKQRIIDDLLRLECLVPEPERKGAHIYRYLIVAGRTSDLREMFIDSKMKSKSQFKFIDGILGTKRNETTRVIYEKLESEQKDLFDKFAENYESRIPKRLLTELVYEQESKDIGIYCWRIRCSEHRQVVEGVPTDTSAETADPS